MCVVGLTGALGYTDGAILVLCIGVGLQFEFMLVVDESPGTKRHTGARVVEVSASLYNIIKQVNNTAHS